MKLLNKITLWPKEFVDNKILVSYFGSHLHGTNTCDSDTDIHVIYIPDEQSVLPKDFISGYDKPYEVKNNFYEKVEFEGKKYDVKFTSIISFFKQIEQGSPNALEILYAPREALIYCDAFGDTLRLLRRHYTTLLSVPKFIGTSDSHWKAAKYENYPGRCENRKQLSESIRMLLDCHKYLSLRYGEQCSQTKDFLKDIKGSDKKLDIIMMSFDKYREELKTEIKELEAKSYLPKSVDLDRSRMFLKDILVNFYMR